VWTSVTRTQDDEDLKALRRVTGNATFQAGDGDLCLKGTRLDIFQRVEDWLDTIDGSVMLWIHGFPGAGKSAIARTIVNMLKKRWSLGSDFFFSRDDAERRTPLALWCHVLYDLSCQHPGFRDAALAKLQAPDFKIGSAQPGAIVDIIVEAIQVANEDTNSSGQNLVLVIDALDECLYLPTSLSRQRSAVLSGLQKLCAIKSAWCRIIVTSRAEKDIEAILNTENITQIELLAGGVVNAQSSDDIKRYFDVYLLRGLPKAKATSEDIQDLVTKAAGLFIWAKTAVEFVSSSKGFPHKRLQTLKDVGFGAGSLSTLYHLVLTNQFGETGSIDQEVCWHFQQVVGTMLVAAVPLTLEQLEGLLLPKASPKSHDRTDRDTILDILNRLSTVTIWQSLESSDAPVIQFTHLSFPEFLQDAGNKNKFYGIDTQIAHGTLSLQCLLVMNYELMFNICHLPSSHYPNKHYDLHTLVNTHLSLALQYSIQHWSSHLVPVARNDAVLHQLNRFLGEKLLFWYESMSLVGAFYNATVALQECASWFTVCEL